MTLRARLFSREVVPFYLSLLALAVAALLADAALHLLNAVWVGRWLGIPGVLLILGSMGYSLRKRKLIQRGKPVTLLRLHEYMAWAGSLLVLVHAGIHFNAILGWLAVGGHAHQRGQRAHGQVPHAARPAPARRSPGADAPARPDR